MKNILACSKLLSGETVAAKTALEIASKSNGKVFLMNLKEGPLSMMQPVLNAGIGIQSESEIDEPEELINFLLDTDIKSANVPLAYIGEELEGLKANKCNKVNMVVTTVDDDSRQGITNLASMFRSLDCPVLLMNPDSPPAPPQRIAYITDLRYFDWALFTPFMSLYRPFKPEIMVVHVTASGLPDIEDCYAESLFADVIAPRMAYKKSSLINLLGNDSINDMQNVTEVMKPEMVVLGSRIPGYFNRLYTGTGATSLYADLPVMLFN